MDPLRSNSSYSEQPRPKKGGCFSKGCTGCSLGCGALVLILFISVMGFYRWLVAPADITPARSMVGPKDRDFMVAQFDSANPGAIAVVTHILDRALAAPQNNQPLSPDEAQRASTIAHLMPRMELAVTGRSDNKAGSDRMVFFSFGAFKNMGPFFDKWFLQKQGENTVYRDKVVHIVHNKARDGGPDHAYDAFFTFVGGANVIYAESQPHINECIDRFLSPSGTFGGADDVKALYEAADPTRPVVGVSTTAPGMQALFHSATDGSDALYPLSESDTHTVLDKLVDVAYSVDLLSSERSTFKILLDTRPGTTPQVATLLQHRTEALQKAGKLSDGSVKTDGARVTLVFTLADMTKRTDKFFQSNPPTNGSEPAIHATVRVPASSESGRPQDDESGSPEASASSSPSASSTSSP